MWQSNYTPVNKPVLGEKYHVKWATKPGMVWRCVEIQDDTVTLMTPKTKKRMTGILKTDLLHIKKNSFKG